MPQSQYTRSYTSFGGVDIVATFNGRVIGELQAITYSVTREKAPIYTMGSPDPRSFSRGKRGIAGSLVFTVLDRDAFYNLKGEAATFYTAYANTYDPSQTEAGIYVPRYVYTEGGWTNLMQSRVGDGVTNPALANLFSASEAIYADQIPPFDITITMQNEYGQAARLSIYGVEILNEGSGMSIDDLTTEKACTYVARGLSHLTPVTQ